MGRLLVTLSAIGLLGMSLGCHHTAGMCDCDARTWGCRTGPEGYAPITPVVSAPQAEMLKEMPKGKEKN